MGWVAHRQEGGKWEGEVCRSPGKDVEGSHLPCFSPHTSPGLCQEAWPCESRYPLGCGWGGEPKVLYPQLPLGLLLFSVDTSLHPLQKST